MERDVRHPDVVFGVHRDAMRHVEQVTAPVADHGSTFGVQRQNCRYSYGALSNVLEVVAGVKTAASQSNSVGIRRRLRTSVPSYSSGLRSSKNLGHIYNRRHSFSLTVNSRYNGVGYNGQNLLVQL